MASIAKVEQVDLNTLKPYEHNAKVHTAEQIDKLIASIEEFGFLNPCLIDKDYNIIAGHGRVMAAKEMGMDKVPCVFVEGLSDAQRKAYLLADNRLAELAEWDWNIVDCELGELEEMDFDIDILGFDNDEINPEDFDTEFSLADGDKSEICQMTFTVHEEQKGLIEYVLSQVEINDADTYGNTNQKGNAIYKVVKQWAEQRK